jgi:hypothetical protein
MKGPPLFTRTQPCISAFSSCSRANFKREPASGVDIAVTVSLKVLDLDGRLEKSDILSQHLASAFFVGRLQS